LLALKFVHRTDAGARQSLLNFKDLRVVRRDAGKTFTGARMICELVRRGKTKLVFIRYRDVDSTLSLMTSSSPAHKL
jgi:hypothetical protein